MCLSEMIVLRRSFGFEDEKRLENQTEWSNSRVWSLFGGEGYISQFQALAKELDSKLIYLSRLN